MKNVKKRSGILCLALLVCTSCARYESNKKNSNTMATRETGRHFLEQGTTEECGYGLYSYFLLGSPPSDNNRNRYFKAVAALLRFVPEITDLQHAGISQRALNITYIPVVRISEQPSKKSGATEFQNDTDSIDALALWVLGNYDYPRARRLISTLPQGPHIEGPYLVSTLKPLSGMERITEQYLYQDLSSVPPEIIDPWIKAFMNQASQEQFWEARNAEQFALRLRQAIAIVADGTSQSGRALPKAKKALSSLIEWKK